MVKKESLIPTEYSNIHKKYKLSKGMLGEGTYGYVKLATRLGDSSKVAIKVIPKTKLRRRDRLDREITIMKKVDHPNIVRVHEIYEDSFNVYLVMELCEGGELYDRMTRLGRLTEKQAADTFSQMLSSVAYLHTNNIVHRDVKPENFLFTSDEFYSTLKLIDFGLSKECQPGTELTTKIGTCYYISPETLSGSYGLKCDLWSLGVILFMMLSGYPPFDGNSDSEIIQSVRESKYDFSEKVWEHVSWSAKDLVSKLLEVDPKARLSAEEALNHPWLKSFEKPPLSPLKLDVVSLQKYQEFPVFVKAVLNYIATQCSHSELQKLLGVFKRLDTNKEGILSPSSIKGAIPEIPELPENVVLNSFIAATMEKATCLRTEKLRVAFERFDIHGLGEITPEELWETFDEQQSLKNMYIYQNMVKEVDYDCDGVISFDEFQTIMRSTL